MDKIKKGLISILMALLGGIAIVVVNVVPIIIGVMIVVWSLRFMGVGI